MSKRMDKTELALTIIIFLIFGILPVILISR